MSQRPFQPQFFDHEGDLSILKDGRPLRILVIPMETGRPKEHVTGEERRREIAGSAALPSPARNPQMRGTTLALPLAVGRDLGDDAHGAMFDLLDESAPAHLFDCDAMACIRLCSATDRGTSDLNEASLTCRCLGRRLPLGDSCVRL